MTGASWLNRLERLYAVAEELRRRAPQTVSASDLAERFEVTRRTIERDLLALREAGVPVYASRGRNGGSSVVEQGGRSVVSLSATEVTALLVAVSASGRAPYRDAAVAASRRLQDSLVGAERVVADVLVSRIRTAEPDLASVSVRVQRTLEEAVRVQGVVNISYTDGGGMSTNRAVEAVGFYCGGGRWYLIAWCRLRDDRRLFRIDRVEAANLTRMRFEPRDPDEVLGWIPHDLVDV